MGELGSSLAAMRCIRASRLSAVSVTVMVLECSGAACAADLGNMATKAPPVPPGPATCTSVEDFFTTACQLSWFGVRFYGTVDVGGSYQTNWNLWNPFRAKPEKNEQNESFGIFTAIYADLKISSQRRSGKAIH